MNVDVVDFFEWAWTLCHAVSIIGLVYVVREAVLDILAARTVKPSENGRRGIYAAMSLRIRLFLLGVNTLFFLSGVGAILSENPQGELALSRVATSLAAIAFAVFGDAVVILDFVDRRKIRNYKSRKNDIVTP